MDKEELQARAKTFGVRAIRLVDALPTTAAGRTLGGQLLRSATSVGANYRAAGRARSRAEFIAKVGTVVEEADESAYWLELIAEVGLLRGERVGALRKEADELTAIFTAIHKTARKNRGA